MRLVLNASPIICLAKAGLLNEVLSMAQEVVVPQTVAGEILAVDDEPRCGCCMDQDGEGATRLARCWGASVFRSRVGSWSRRIGGDHCGGWFTGIGCRSR